MDTTTAKRATRRIQDSRRLGTSTPTAMVLAMRIVTGRRPARFSGHSQSPPTRSLPRKASIPVHQSSDHLLPATDFRRLRLTPAMRAYNVRPHRRDLCATLSHSLRTASQAQSSPFHIHSAASRTSHKRQSHGSIPHWLLRMARCSGPCITPVHCPLLSSKRCYRSSVTQNTNRTSRSPNLGSRPNARSQHMPLLPQARPPALVVRSRRFRLQQSSTLRPVPAIRALPPSLPLLVLRAQSCCQPPSKQRLSRGTTSAAAWRR